MWTHGDTWTKETLFNSPLDLPGRKENVQSVSIPGGKRRFNFKTSYERVFRVFVGTGDASCENKISRCWLNEYLVFSWLLLPGGEQRALSCRFHSTGWHFFAVWVWRIRFRRTDAIVPLSHLFNEPHLGAGGQGACCCRMLHPGTRIRSGEKVGRWW